MLVLYCLLLAGGAHRLTPQEFLERLPLIKTRIGEQAQYHGYVFKGPIRVHVGKATFTVEERKGNDPAVILRGVAKGGKFGYNVRMEVETTLDPESCLPRSSFSQKTGSERRFERYLFQKGSIMYFKKKHCKVKGCTNPAHMIKKTKWWGPFPSGTEVVHCPGCKNLKHYVWRLIYHHKVSTPFLDMISALFAARNCDFDVGASFVVPLVQARDRWDVTVTVAKEERIKVKAGTFDCVQVILQPKNVGDRKNVKGKFAGLFGIKGSIKIWVDRKTRIPVRILGTIPFAFMDLHAEVCLRKFVPAPKLEKKAPEKKVAVN